MLGKARNGQPNRHELAPKVLDALVIDRVVESARKICGQLFGALARPSRITEQTGVHWTAHLGTEVSNKGSRELANIAQLGTGRQTCQNVAQRHECGCPSAKLSENGTAALRELEVLVHRLHAFVVRRQQTVPARQRGGTSGLGSPSALMEPFVAAQTLGVLMRKQARKR